MRRFVGTTIIAVVLMTGAVSAQSGTYVGASAGFPLLLNVHAGFTDLIASDVDLRLNLGGAMIGVDGFLAFVGVVGADALYRFASDGDAAAGPYAGAGLGAGFAGGGGAGEYGAGFALNVAAVVGFEHRAHDVGYFLELRGNLTVPGDGGFFVWPNVGVGVNFHY